MWISTKTNVRTIAVEPENSPALSGGAYSQYMVLGIGGVFVPDVLDTSLIVEGLLVSNNKQSKQPAN